MFDYKFILILSFMKEIHFFFPAIYDSSKQKLCKIGMNVGIMKLFPLLLKFFH